MLFTLLRICSLTALLLVAAVPVQAQPQLVMIGAGSVNGVYYAVAGGLCRQLNKDRAAHVRCAVEVSEGSVSNVNLLRRGVVPFALMQADVQYNAYEGQGPFAASGAQKDLRSVFSLYPELVTLVASADIDARSLTDLKGRRLSRGLPGSGNRATMDSVVTALGWTPADLPVVQERGVDEQGYALCEKKLDAYAYLAGHPAPNVLRTVKTCSARLLPLPPSVIASLVAGKPYLGAAEIAANTYPGQTAPVPSVGVMATLTVLESTPEEQVYRLVKAVFENLDAVRQSVPVLAGLAPQNMVRHGLSAPLHPGALRYYREKGWL